MGLFVIGFVTLLLIVVTMVFQKTNIGLALRASAYAPEIAQLSGIRVSGIRTLGWAIAGASGAAAGILQTVNGTGALTPESLEFSLLLVFGFIAAVIGGLESLPGAVLGSLILGLVLAFVQIYISGTHTFNFSPTRLLGFKGGSPCLKNIRYLPSYSLVLFSTLLVIVSMSYLSIMVRPLVSTS
jgi:branched-chain amino acid transport system permease protein